MEIEGMIIKDLGMFEGTSKSTGNIWRKHEWILETPGQFPKKVKITAFGDRALNINLETGKYYSVSVDIESREFQERWYTDVRVFNYRPIEAPAAAQPFQPAPAATAPTFAQPAAAAPAPEQPFGATANDFAKQDPTEDLPF